MKLFEEAAKHIEEEEFHVEHLDLFGVKVYANDQLTISVTHSRDRTWRERLFSWPWRPWVREAWWTEQEPDPAIYMVDIDEYLAFAGGAKIGKTAIMHPRTLEIIRNLDPETGHT